MIMSTEYETSYESESEDHGFMSLRESVNYWLLYNGPTEQVWSITADMDCFIIRMIDLIILINGIYDQWSDFPVQHGGISSRKHT